VFVGVLVPGVCVDALDTGLQHVGYGQEQMGQEPCRTVVMILGLASLNRLVFGSCAAVHVLLIILLLSDQNPGDPASGGRFEHKRGCSRSWS
jgi:hypothetical protein